VHVIELANGMSVGVDAEHATELQHRLMPAPVKIKPPRMRVDFDCNAMLRAGDAKGRRLPWLW
jgi:hypothetical protein